MKYLINLDTYKIDQDFTNLISIITNSNEPLVDLGIQGLPKKIMDNLPFEYFTQLKSLRIIGCDINGFFSNSHYFQKINKIFIQQTQDDKIDTPQRLDEEFKSLKNLVELEIFSYQLREIPEFISSLSNLKLLGLSILDKIPSNLECLANLKSFGVSVLNSEVEILNLFDTISTIKTLDSFGYTDPYTTFCPDFKENLLTLKSFSFSMLKVQDLPAILPQMTELKYLYLSNNLQSIPKWITNLKKLEYLTIEGLVDGKLPIFLKELPKLHTVNLVACLDILMDEERIEKIKKDFPELKILGVNADN